MNYANNEKTRNGQLIGSDLFNKDGGWGSKKTKSGNQSYKHVLTKYENNLYESIRDLVPNGFNWHSANEDTISSQVACVNHLFPIRQNRDAILAILNNIEKGITFEEVMPIYKPGGNVFVDFERSDPKLMNESTPTRIDALILAKKDKNSKDTTLVVIEWKYTENNTKDNTNKQGIYNGFLNAQNSNIKNCKDLNLNSYDELFRDPLYQLMRETLWAAELIKNKGLINGNSIIMGNTELVDYIHLHIVPKRNEVLRKKLKQWKKWLITPDKYILKDPEELFKPLDNKRSLLKKSACIKDPDDYIEYLRTRYWK